MHVPRIPRGGRAQAVDAAAPRTLAPRAAVQLAGGGTLITTAEQLGEVLRGGSESAAGVRVTPDSAMRVGAVYACVRLISGAPANGIAALVMALGIAMVSKDETPSVYETRGALVL